MSKTLDEILASAYYSGHEHCKEDGCDGYFSDREPKEQIKALFLELVGEDPEGDSATEPGKCNLACHAITERLTKKELRDKINQL